MIQIYILPVKSGLHISETESTNVNAVLNTQTFSVDEYGNVSHCHCKRFIIASCVIRTPEKKQNVMKNIVEKFSFVG